MSAAVLQGVPVATLDVDLWVDLPSRQYMRVLRLALAQGAQIIRNTVVELVDGTLVNFIYEVSGLGSFAHEFKHAKVLAFQNLKVRVLSLERIKLSKMAIMRPKDVAHIQSIDATLRTLKAGRKK